MLRQIIGRFIKPDSITAIPYGTSYTVQLRLVRPVFDVVTTPNAVAEPATITVTLDVNGYFPNDLFVMPGLYEVLTPYSPPRRVVIPAGNDPFDLVHALAQQSIAVAPSVLNQLLAGYLTHDDLNAHIATIGGVSLGHVKNGGNVVIEPDGTLTAPDPDLSGYATTNAMQAADQGLQTQITANTSALTSKADLVGGKVPTSQLPAITIGETFTVNSQAAMLALTAQIGDIAMRSDLSNRKFLLTGTATTLADWIEIGATDAVSSVNGQTGVVMLSAADVGAATASHTHSHTVLTDIGTNTHAQIDSHIANMNNPHAVTAAQIGALTQTQADARYQLAASIPAGLLSLNLSQCWMLERSFQNSVSGGYPLMVVGKTHQRNGWKPTGWQSNTDGDGALAYPSSCGYSGSQTWYFVLKYVSGAMYVLTSYFNGSGDRGIEVWITEGKARIVVGDSAGGLDALTGTVNIAASNWMLLTLRYTAGVGLDAFQNTATTPLAALSTPRIAAAADTLFFGGAVLNGIYSENPVDLGMIVQYQGSAHSTSEIATNYAAIKAAMSTRGVVLP